MKNYSKDVILNIQRAIDKGEYSLSDINSFDEMPHTIKLNGVTLRLTENADGRHETHIMLSDTFDKEDSGIYKKNALGKFYSKDWKLGNKGENTYNKYKIFNAEIKGVQISALLRDITDYEYGELDEPDYYNDITIDGVQYAIIKAYCPNIDESFNMKSLFDEHNFSEKILTSLGMMPNDEDNEDDAIIVSRQDDASETIELF